jgi:hypothetical protein
MLLTELREQIEQGKVAQLFIPKTHEYGIDVTIKVLKKESQFIWQREKIEEPLIGLNLPEQTSQFNTWDELIEKLRNSMQLRDGTWEIEQLIETPQLNEHPLEPAPAPSSPRPYPDLEGE